jgi:predicted ATP-dependent protease
MERLVEESKARLGRVFDSEEFERQKSQILEELSRRQQEEMSRFEEPARAERFAVLRTPSGVAVAPAPRGEPLTTEQYEALPEPIKQQVQARGAVLDVLDLIRESAFWAGQRGHPHVRGKDVSDAIARKVERENLLEERTRRLIGEGVLLVDTDGADVGQVNEPALSSIRRTTTGIAMLSLGDHAFGRPSRITARTFAGKPGVVDIEREAKLGGRIHSKGVMILSNETIEGFFDVCRSRELTGRQGVVIPEANPRHLMLREDVVQAVREGRFRVHADSTVDEGLTLLAGRPAGGRGPDGRFAEGSVNAAVEESLEGNVKRRRALRGDRGHAGTA